MQLRGGVFFKRLGLFFCLVFLLAPVAYGGARKGLYLIADLHYYPKVQLEIADSLSRLSPEVVLCEGGWGKADLSFLKGCTSREVRVLVEGGMLSGAEFWAYERGGTLLGLEDKDAYLRHLQMFHWVTSHRTELLDYLYRTGLIDVDLFRRAVLLRITPGEFYRILDIGGGDLEALRDVIAFYSFSRRREKAFLRQISQALSKHDRVAVVLGGYHLRRIERYLRAHFPKVKVIYPLPGGDEGPPGVRSQLIPEPLLSFLPRANLVRRRIELKANRVHPAFSLPLSILEGWIERLKGLGVKEEVIDWIAVHGVGYLDERISRAVLLRDYLRSIGEPEERIALIESVLQDLFRKETGLDLTPQVVHFHELLHHLIASDAKIAGLLPRAKRLARERLDLEAIESRFKGLYYSEGESWEELVINFIQWQYLGGKGREFLASFLSGEELEAILPILGPLYDRMIDRISSEEAGDSYFSHQIQLARSTIKEFLRELNLPRDRVLDLAGLLLVLSAHYADRPVDLEVKGKNGMLAEMFSFLKGEGVKIDTREIVEWMRGRDRLRIGIKGTPLALALAWEAGELLLDLGKEVEVSVLEGDYLYIPREGKRALLPKYARVISKTGGKRVDISVGETGLPSKIYLSPREGAESWIRIVVQRELFSQRSSLPPRQPESEDLSELLEVKERYFPFLDPPKVTPADVNFLRKVLELSRSTPILKAYEGISPMDRIVKMQRELPEGAKRAVVLLPFHRRKGAYYRALGSLFKRSPKAFRLQLAGALQVFTLPPNISVFYDDEDYVWPAGLWKLWQVKYLTALLKGALESPPEASDLFISGEEGSEILRIIKIANKRTPAQSVEGEEDVYRLLNYRLYRLDALPKREIVELLEKNDITVKARIGEYLRTERGYVLHFSVVRDSARPLDSQEEEAVRDLLLRSGIGWDRELGISGIFRKESGKIVCVRPDRLFERFVFLSDERYLKRFWEVFTRHYYEKYIAIPEEVVERIEIESGLSRAGLSWKDVTKVKTADQLEEVFASIIGIKEPKRPPKSSRALIKILKEARPTVVRLRVKVGVTIPLTFWFYERTERIAPVGVRQEDLEKFRFDQLISLTKISPAQMVPVFSSQRLATLILYWDYFKHYDTSSVLYPASGSDVFYPFFLFDCEALTMVDVIPWGSCDHPDDVSLSEFQEYLEYAGKRGGFLLGERLRENGALGKYILGEIRYLLGAKDIRVRVDEEAVEVLFRWRHPISGKKALRRLRFLSHRLGLLGVQDRLREMARVKKFSVAFLKASENLWGETPGIEALFKDLLKEDGILVSDFRPLKVNALMEVDSYPESIFWCASKYQTGLGYIPSQPGFLLGFVPRDVLRLKDQIERLETVDLAQIKASGPADKIGLSVLLGKERVEVSAHGKEWRKNWRRLLLELLRRVAELRVRESRLVHATDFYRNSRAYFFLEHDLLPEILEKHTSEGENRIRIVSVGSSYGEETATLMHILDPVLKTHPYLDVEFYLLDISPSVLDKAKSQIWLPHRLPNTPYEYTPDQRLWRKRARFHFIPIDLNDPGWREIVKEVFLKPADLLLYNVVELYLDDAQKLPVRRWVMSLVRKGGAIMTEVELPVEEGSWEVSQDFGYDTMEYSARWYVKKE